MKKIKNLFIALLLVVGGSAFAEFGVGPELGFDLGLHFNTNFSATYRSDEMPWCFSVNASPFSSRVVAVADNWFVDETLSNPINFYAFWGISAGIGFDPFQIDAGARIGCGINWFILDKKQLEFYVQVAYNPYMGVKYDWADKVDKNGNLDKEWGFVFNPLNFPFATGARWWFK